MSTVISPALAPANAARTAAGTARNTESNEGKRFDMALEQSRAARAGRTEERTDAADSEVGERRTARGHERKGKLSADEVMAMLAPLPAAIVPLAAQLAPASAGAGARAGAAATAALDPLAGDAAAGLPGAGGMASAPGAIASGGDTTAPGRDTQPGAARADAAAAEAALPAATPGDAAEGTTPLSPAEGVDTTDLAAASSSTLPPGSRPARTGSGTGTNTTQALQAGASGATATAGAAAAAALPAADALASAIAAGAAVSGAGAAAAGGDAAADTAADTPTPIAAWQSGGGVAPADRAGATAATTPVLSLAPPVGDDAWGPAIAQQMIRMAATGHHVARLNLNPAELGPLQVTLTLSENQTQAAFVSAHEAVRKAVEAALPQLRSTLAAQGIELGHTSVGAESHQPSGQGAGFAGDDAPRRRAQADYPGAGRGAAAVTAATATAPPARPRALSALDTFA